MKTFVLAAAAALSAVAVAEPIDSTWRCIGGINTPLRRFGGDDVECASLNGRDCLWTSDVNACRNVIKTQSLNSGNANVDPLSCGAEHKRLYGSSGYDNPAHWCAKGYTIMAPYAGKTPWTCINGINTPVRVNNWGDVECMSYNRRDCLWRSSQAECNQLATNPTRSVIPLDCRNDHLVEHGSVGYDANGHWCQTSAKVFGLMR